MSLVNNMLRDLDQRRKETDSSSGSVKLMPAREFVERGKKSIVPIIVIGLLLVAIALLYVWEQLVLSNNEQQQLDIRLQPQATNSTSDPEQLIQELEQSIVQAEIDANAQSVSQPDAGAPQDSEEPMQEPTEVADQSVAQPIVAIEAPETETLDSPAPSASSNSVASSTDTIVSDPQLVRSGPVGSVKEAPEYSNEQLDTIAVQTALRQISNGQAGEAYATLENYILANRSAHQSRETYAKLLMSRGRTADASALIDAGLDLAPNHSGFKKVKARLLMSEGNLTEAVSILISRAPPIANDPEYHDLLASAQLSSRDFSGAMISYRGLVQLDETQGKWWYGFAAAHDQLGNSQPARQAYAQAMQYPNLSANLRRRSQERLSELAP